MVQSWQESIKYAFILGFVGFVTSFGAHIVNVNLPFYAQQVGVGVGVAMIGLIIAVYDFAEIIAKPIFGTLADKQGMKKTMLVGILLFTLASLLYLWIDPRLLLFVRFLQGVGAAALSAVSLALVGVYYKENSGRAFGIYNAIKGAGYVISPALGGTIVLKSGFASIFLTTAAIGAIAFFISLSLPNPKESHAKGIEDDEDNFSVKSFIAVFREPRLLKWYVVIVANMFFVSILFGFLPVYVHSLGYNPLLTGTLLSIVSVSYLLIQPIAGWFADKTDAVATINIGLLISAIGIIMIPFVKDVPLVLISVLAGAGVGTVWTNSDNLISKLAKEGQLGATMGAAGSFKELGDMVGPIFIGVLSQGFGLKVGFITCGTAGLLSLWLIFKKNE
ncbi:MAG: MFS transporter [Thermoproteota archaeon]